MSLLSHYSVENCQGHLGQWPKDEHDVADAIYWLHKWGPVQKVKEQKEAHFYFPIFNWVLYYFFI